MQDYNKDLDDEPKNDNPPWVEADDELEVRLNKKINELKWIMIFTFFVIYFFK